MTFDIRNTNYKKISSNIYNEHKNNNCLKLSNDFEFDNKDKNISRNVVVIGSGRCGKTKGFIAPNIEEGMDSFVVVDRDNELRKNFKSNGQYNDVFYLDPINKEGKHNPFCYLETKEDVENFTRALHRLVVRSYFEAKDPVRDKLELDILTAYVKFIAYGYGYNSLICGSKIYPKSFRGLKNLVMSGDIQKYTQRAKNIVGVLPSSFRVFENDLEQDENSEINRELRAAMTSVSINLGTFLTDTLLDMTDDCSFDMKKFLDIEKENRVGLFVNTNLEKNKFATLVVWHIADKLRRLKDENGDKVTSKSTVNFYLDNFGDIPKLPNSTILFEGSKLSNYNFILCFKHFTELEIRYGDKLPKVLDTCQFLMAYPFNPDTKTCNFIKEQVLEYGNSSDVDELLDCFTSDKVKGKVLIVSRKGPAFIDTALHSKDYVECDQY